MTSSAIASIGENIESGEKLVVLPRAEFNRVKKHIHSGKIFAGYEEVLFGGKKHKVPAYQLLGKWADDLDNVVEKGLMEYAAGQYVRGSSLKALILKSKRGRK